MAPWYDRLADRTTAWSPSVALAPGREAIRQRVRQSAAARAPWLYHPCVSGMTHGDERGRPARDVALAGWLARNTRMDGEVVLEEPAWCWSDGGGFLLSAGPHTLDEIGSAQCEEDRALPIPFDPWCTLLGYPHPDSWSASCRPDADIEAGVQRSAMVALRALALLQAVLPETFLWLRSLAKLLVILDGADNLARSSSSAELPGVIFADAISEASLLELMVHESAHHLLYITEAAGPLINPAETRRFASPLRADPRPLRGILLAYHALAFMCAFYKDLSLSSVGQEATDAADLADLRCKMVEAGRTLDAAAGSFTDRGRDFLEQTHGIASYAL